jgi:uncharacterized damage-inducible protein DinB
MGRSSDLAITNLLSQLDEAFDRHSWHGTNLRGSLRGLSARDASWRPAAVRHNIWEIAVHAAYWKYAARRRLTGEKRGTFPYDGSNWFRRPEGGGDDLWRADLALLAGEHRKLRQAIAALRGADLAKTAAGGRTTMGALVRGVAAHDLYHAGQIQLLKRLRR